jgi:GT2 family glycosyltransferase
MEFYAVIPTHNRRKEALELLNQLAFQGVKPQHIMVIDNSDWGYRIFNDVMRFEPGVRYRWDGDTTPHIYQMWNRGLEWAQDKATRFPSMDHEYAKVLGAVSEHCVAVLNDDVVLPNNFVDRMTEVMETSNPTIAFPNQHGHRVGLFNKTPGPVDLSHRTSGYCFVVNGLSGIRLDEDFKWWYGDDDLDWRAREMNGTYMVQDVTVHHLYPSESTNNSPERSAQARIDRETFVKKHGRAPW